MLHSRIYDRISLRQYAELYTFDIAFQADKINAVVSRVHNVSSLGYRNSFHDFYIRILQKHNRTSRHVTLKFAALAIRFVT